MPARTRESDLDRGRDSPRKESSKLEKPSRERRHKHRKSSDREKTADKVSPSSSETPRRSSMPNINDVENKPFPSESKASLPYPSFSKSHSREAVGSRENFRPVLNILTPESTDLNASRTKIAQPTTAPSRNAPPSPPLTQVDQQQSKGERSNSARPVEVETIIEETKSQLESNTKDKPRTNTITPNGRRRGTSDISFDGSPRKPHTRPKPTAPLKRALEHDLKLPQRSTSQPTRTASPVPSLTSSASATNTSSNATSIAPEQPTIQRPGSKLPPAAAVDDGISVVSSIPGAFPHGGSPVEIFVENERTPDFDTPAANTPPPPPPPPAMPIIAPKVDYLLLNGGLQQNIPKNLLLAGKPMVVQQASTPQQAPVVVANLFEPYNQLLEDFSKVISKNGSLAVATGYRSVARRLLDRLEAVFARDISSESCQCDMCRREQQEVDDVRGVSWGEILELVSGRRDLPIWPPFTFVASPIGLGISLETHVPMQKLDVDVPEEYRDHYIRQSRKTKQSVDKWLNRQVDDPSSPPEEVDDETLTFAILTHLAIELRADFKNLLGIVDAPIQPPRRAPSPDKGIPPVPVPTPQPRQRPEPLLVASRAIQRLYRLTNSPRDPETAIFLLNNPKLHNALATLAAISDDEWDILVSGRFDGFLRSGAEDIPIPESIPPSSRNTPFRANLSRGPTPARMNGHARQGNHPSRTTTPALGGAMSGQHGGPIAFDEETEIATLAEIERDIYLGMEALEDAFEALHIKAETVRLALRTRGAGLAATAQRRRGGADGGIEVRMGTPASGLNGEMPWDVETDDGMGDWDGISELAPDDSASNISTSRRRRPKRRHDRRTPALVEEDETEWGSEEGSPRKR